jgi:hypothetical protein
MAYTFIIKAHQIPHVPEGISAKQSILIKMLSLPSNGSPVK